MNSLIVSSSPPVIRRVHIRIMLDVVLAFIPAIVAAVYFFREG